jgi:hypothetical protein
MTLLPQVRSQLDSAAHRRPPRRGRAGLPRIPNPAFPTRFPTLGGAIATVAVIVALGIGAGAIALLGHHKPTNGPASPHTQGASSAVTTTERYAASQFAVFARTQTPKDRSLPMLLDRAIRLGGLGSGFGDVLQGVIPSLTRYTQTLSDGREVFLTVSNPETDTKLPRRARRTVPPNSVLLVGIVTVQPDGRWTNGQPVTNPSGGETATSAYYAARTGRQGCGLDTYWVIVPNQVSRIRWQFARQDPLGYVFNAPLSVDMTVHGNVAVTTIPQRASCDRPAAVTLYGRSGEILSHTGSTNNLNRITRPVNHGDPFAYKRLFFHRLTKEH